MIDIRNECRGCATESYPCLGSTCKYRNVPYLVCDECGEDKEDLYEFEGRWLCADCIEDTFKDRGDFSLNREEFDPFIWYDCEWILLDEFLESLPKTTEGDLDWYGL